MFNAADCTLDLGVGLTKESSSEIHLNVEGLRILGDLVAAMERSITIGSTDHLDCSDDQGEFWYKPLREAKDLLAKREGS